MTPATRPIRVLIVEDSASVRRMLEGLVEHDPRLELVGSVPDAEQALSGLVRLRPDVISMDVQLPGMDGLEATRTIMERQPTPIVIVSAMCDAEHRISMNALRAGALTVVEKPSAIGSPDFEKSAAHFCTQLCIMSQVPLVRQRIRRDPPLSKPSPWSSGRVDAVPRPGGGFRMLAIVASTGGPNALVRLISQLPTDFPMPVCVVQHIGSEFVAGFAGWLDSLVPLPVTVAQAGEIPRPGSVHIAPGGGHLRVTPQGFHITHDASVDGMSPSGTVLLSSVANSYGPRGIGVLLTGMGEDGAQGMLDLRKAGGLTIAEDETTAVVYGMPAAAVRLDAVDHLLPLDRIAPRIRRLIAAEGGL